ncbi:hypothetical protein TrLO_g13774 [Triparma laevis f. longispina]|uniref:Uncharacterized protein n=1 Tax=Triparma laevis f. longispina TaxID=1714387 RepID=A0A9W7E1T5_9STRA|nr:hypothetical protein TrLO_g13774 [Triparma laevis f. longispina]
MSHFKLPSAESVKSIINKAKEKVEEGVEALTPKNTSQGPKSINPFNKKVQDDSSASSGANVGSLAAGKETLLEIQARIDAKKAEGAIVPCTPTGPTSLPVLSLIRGSRCPKCSERAYLTARKTGRHPPIRGLNSTWITPTLMASNRPSNRLIEEYRITEQCEKQNVTLIVNLCEPGEHPYCGDGNLTTNGHPYDFDLFSNAGVSVVNFGWPDMSFPSFRYMMSICKVILGHTRRGGKALVHCHAGFGRTGVVIACVMMCEDFHLNPYRAIDYIRGKRDGCIQTMGQQRFLIEFKEVVSQVHRVFGDKNFSLDSINHDYLNERLDEIRNFEESTDPPSSSASVPSSPIHPPTQSDNDTFPANSPANENSPSKPAQQNNSDKFTLEAPPPSDLKPLKRFLGRFSRRASIEMELRTAKGSRHTLLIDGAHSAHSSSSPNPNPSPQNTCVTLKEAMARQDFFSHDEEEKEPAIVTQLCKIMMQYARSNPVAVSTAFIGVNASGWPGRSYNAEWEGAFEKVYPSLKREEAGTTANAFSNMLSAGGGDSRDLNLDLEEKKTENETPRDEFEEPTFSPPRWGVFDEENIENIKSRVNENDWRSLDHLQSTSDNAEFDIDARLPTQLLLDFLSSLSEPIIDLESTSLVWAYNTDHRMDVDEDSPMPPLTEANINKKQKRSRWTVKKASFINELIKVERKSYADNVKVVKKKGGKVNKAVKAQENVPMDPEAAMRLFVSFVQCPYARCVVQSILRVLSKCKSVTPETVWKRACIRVGIALTQFTVKADSIKGGSVLMGRDLVEFGLEEFPDIVKISRKSETNNESQEPEGGDAENDDAGRTFPGQISEAEKYRLEERAAHELDVSPITVTTVKQVADYAILLGRLVESLCHIYNNAGQNLRVNQTPEQEKKLSTIIRAKGYFDLQSLSWVAIEGFSGIWDEERLDKSGPQVQGGDTKFSSKNVVATMKAAEVIDPDKPQFSASTPMEFASLIYKEAVKKKEDTDNSLANSVKGDFTSDNINLIRENGGCEYLYKSYMVDVSEQRRKESGYFREITSRARYLKWLREGKKGWIDVAEQLGSPSKKNKLDEYTFGKVEVDIKNADKKFDVLESPKKKKTKKKKTKKTEEGEGGDASVTPTPPEKPKLEINTNTNNGETPVEEQKVMQSPLVARLSQKINT